MSFISAPKPTFSIQGLTEGSARGSFALKVMLAVFVIGLSAGVFSKTVLATAFGGLELAFRYFLLVFYLFYIFDRLLIKKQVHFFDVIVFVLLMVPVYTAFSARREFGQPIIMGILAQNYLLMYLAGLFVFYLIRIGWLTLDTVKIGYVTLAWISLVLFMGTELFLNPANYLDSEFVRSKDAKGGYFFKYFTFFIAFGGIYYFTSFLLKKKVLYLLAFSCFLFFMVVINNGRTDMVVFMSAMAFIFFKNQSVKQMLVYSVYALIGVVIFLTVLVIFFPEEAAIMWDMYSAYFTVLTGQESEDNSATSRLLQIGFALEFLLSNPDAIFFGAGKISANYDVFIMRFVNPVDIGLVGLIFSHGIVGMIIMYSQFVFAYNFMGKIRNAKGDTFFLALKFTVLMIFVQSFFKGPLFYMPGQLITVVGILYAYRYLDLEIDAELGQLDESGNPIPTKELKKQGRYLSKG